MNEFLFENKEDYIDYLKSMQSISILENKTYDELKLVSTYVENSGLDEKEASFLYENAMIDLVKALKDFLTKLINAIKDYFARITKSAKEKAEEAEIKKALAELKKSERLKELNIKYNVYAVDGVKEAMDEYIREMVKLERELMSIRVSMGSSAIASNGKDPRALMMVGDYTRIENKLNALNAKYEKVISLDPKTVELAAKDAIRFSDEQLNHVRLNYSAVESGSTKVLEQFKKDANGCEVPVQSNMFQRMANSLATNLRKTEQKLTTIKYNNRGIIIAVAAAVGLGTLGAAISKANDPQGRLFPSAQDAQAAGAGLLGQGVAMMKDLYGPVVQGVKKPVKDIKDAFIKGYNSVD